MYECLIAFVKIELFQSVRRRFQSCLSTVFILIMWSLQLARSQTHLKSVSWRFPPIIKTSFACMNCCDQRECGWSLRVWGFRRWSTTRYWLQVFIIYTENPHLNFALFTRNDKTVPTWHFGMLNSMKREITHRFSNFRWLLEGLNSRVSNLSVPVLIEP